MSSPVDPYTNTTQHDFVDLKPVLIMLWKHKLVIILGTVLGAIAAILFALNLSNVYKAEAVVKSTNGSSPSILDGLSGGLGGLANLAGVSLPSDGGDSTAYVIEVMQSRVFLSHFIDSNKILLDVMGAEDWHALENKVIYDSDIYNIESDKWVRDVKFPFEPKPSMEEAVKEFQKIFRVSLNKDTDLIYISVEHYSPFLAKKWTDLLIRDINEYIKNADKEEAKNSVRYLQKQIKDTIIADERTMLYTMLQEHQKTIMLTQIREEYVFKTVDPSIVPKLPSSPNRAIIVISLTFLSMLTMILAVLSFTFFQSIITSSKK